MIKWSPALQVTLYKWVCTKRVCTNMGMIQAPIASKWWRIEGADFAVVRDGLKPLIGGDLFEALGLSVTQTPNSNEGRMVNAITPQRPFKTRIAKQFPQLISRIGR